MRNRYAIDNVRWLRRGPRHGFLRRRRWQQRIWHVGEANDLETATAILTNAGLRWDEALYLYDMLGVSQGRIAARYGQDWKDG